MQTEIEQLFDHKPPTYTEEHFDLFYQFKHKLNLGEVRAAQPDASAKNGWRVNAVGEEGDSAGVPHGRDRGYVDRPRAAAVLRQGHLSGAAVQRGRRRADRARRVQHSRRLLHRAAA